MQNDSDSPTSKEEQTYVDCITAKTQTIKYKRKTYEMNSTSEDWLVCHIRWKWHKDKIQNWHRESSKHHSKERLPGTEK